MLGKDGGIEQQFKKLEETLLSLIANEAIAMCGKVPDFMMKAFPYQFRQTLEQTYQSYGAESIIKAELAANYSS